MSQIWAYADVGFDTAKQLWFLDLFGGGNTNNGVIFAKHISFKKCSGKQYEWKDQTGDFWHIRHRVFSDDVETIKIDTNDNMEVIGKPKKRDQSLVGNYTLPLNASYVAFAYSLKTARGFIEILDESQVPITRLTTQSIVTENLDMETAGQYPAIRLLAERSAVSNILISDSVAIIRGV